METDLKLTNLTNNFTLANKVEVAKTFAKRSKGLLGRQSLEPKSCLWIHRCPSIHTFFMKFNIDVIFVDKNFRVTSIKEDLSAWRLSWGGIFADSCFEFQGKTLDTTKVKKGDHLHVGS